MQDTFTHPAARLTQWNEHTAPKGRFLLEQEMEQDEIFLIEPEHENREWVHKVASILARSSFQSWDVIEVTGRRAYLLGQPIEEIYHIRHAGFPFDATKMKEIRKLTYPSATLWLENYKHIQQTACHIAP